MSVQKNIKKLESDMKSAVLNHLKDKGRLSQFSTVINELTVNKFSRRVDLVVLEKGRTFAFEIKSASDSLYRLKGQVEEYLEYFDKVTVVAASKHIAKVLAIVPKNVAVWEQKDERIAVVQRGRIIPIKSLPKAIDLLKANELQKLSSKLSIDVEVSTRRYLEEALLSLSEINTAIRQFCFQCLEQRYSFTSQAFWERVGEERISAQDIALLSRSYIQRERNAIHKSEQAHFWAAMERFEFSSFEEANISFGETPDNIRELIAA